MRLAVSSYSFSKLMRQDDFSQLDTIKMAKELGFDAIEFAEILNDPDTGKIEYAVRLKEECDRIDLPVLNLAVSADLLYGSEGDIEKEIVKAKLNIDCAEILGAKLMRHDVCWNIRPGDGRFRGYKVALPRLAYACKEITKYGSEKGIKTMVENHGFFFQDVDRVEALMEEVDDPNFGLLADMGNFLCVDQDPCYSIGRLAPYIFYIHAKDFCFIDGMRIDVARAAEAGNAFIMTRSGNYLKPTVLGHGDVPVTQCLAVLEANGYKGDIAIEFEGMEDTREALQSGLKFLRG
ncbi:MAG: sugar phosphate isomerase/epimerase [Eubacteriales bacterium]|nr:sugar phosphate isomerase/epimerase [Eubacteriales bacterium]MDD4717561.1 sugar phosphate isomerase/epimerase [Eubacteriales bacterium]